MIDDAMDSLNVMVTSLTDMLLQEREANAKLREDNDQLAESARKGELDEALAKLARYEAPGGWMILEERENAMLAAAEEEEEDI